jgi:polysaccharide export outer membrane protein
MTLRHSNAVRAASGAAAIAVLACLTSPASAQAVSGASDASVVTPSSTFPLSSNRNYLIRPGDIISVSVYNEPGFSISAVRVLPGGVIEEPLAGQIHVGGMTPDQAGHAVSHALLQYVRHPAVSVSVAAVAPVDVYILGNVKAPGRYELQPDSRLMDALSAAGGLGPTDGDLPDAHVQTGDNVSIVSLQHLLHDGDLTLNTEIHNQTTIYIPSPTVFNVEVTGAVEHQGDVPMHEGDRLIAAIARAGPSQTNNSDLNHVKLIHRNADGQTTEQIVNMYDVYKSSDPSVDPIVAKGDVIIVPGGKKGAYDPTGPLSTLLYLFRI